MSLLRYTVRMTITTTIIMPLVGLLIYHRVSWLSIVLAVPFGAAAGLISYWPSHRFVKWLERREEKRWRERHALLAALHEAAEEELNR